MDTSMDFSLDSFEMMVELRKGRMNWNPCHRMLCLPVIRIGFEPMTFPPEAECSIQLGIIKTKKGFNCFPFTNYKAP
jgi:hypothetical protein